MPEDAALAQVRAMKNGGAAQPKAGGDGGRINTGMREDPRFRANAAKFHGGEISENDKFYSNYRAFYGGATPNVNQASHMGQGHQTQQRTLLRNKLAENAKRILNTKSFDDGFDIRAHKAAQNQQAAVLQDSGFDATTASKAAAVEPASYQTYATSGDAGFNYARNTKIDKVTKTDPAIKLQNKARYNIITGSLQQWF